MRNGIHNLVKSLLGFFALAASPYFPAEAEPISTAVWVSGLADIEKQARSFLLLSPDRQSSLVLRAYKWSGRFEDWEPKPKNDHAQVHCGMAAQSLVNYLSDLQKRTLRGDTNAEIDLADYREYKSKCLKALR